MLSIEQPQLCQELLKFPGGIHSVCLPGENIDRVLLKLPVNYLLPIKVHQQFKIYVIPVGISDCISVGLMCAFFEDSENPLVCWRLLDSGSASCDLIKALTKREIFLHLFDDNNRELLGYRAQINMPSESRERLVRAKFPNFSHEEFHSAHEQATRWFSIRTENDDRQAINIQLSESLYPEDLMVFDLRPELNKFHGSKGYCFTSLEREEPGFYQEMDVIKLLQRVFRPDQIYHAPKRHYDREEIADVIIITDKTCLIVQAKDSPNTEKTLKRTLKRKRLMSVHMLNDAIGQLSGAVKYIDRTRPLKMLLDGKEVLITIGNRNVLSLAVVRELFNDMYDEYSNSLFGFFNKIQLPCIALDYAELHSYTSYCQNEDSFFSAYFQVFDKARILNFFPRLRFGVNDAEALLRTLDKRGHDK